MSRFKVYSAGISHESHSFSNRYAEMADYEGAEIGWVQADPGLAASRAIEAGILVAAREMDWELVFPFSAAATPSGPLTASTFETLVSSLINELEAAMPVDGILLPLHGAMMAQNFPDTEGEILRRVRDLVGPHVPVAIALDAHANFTRQMAQLANISTCYRTTPHVDQWDTSYRAAHLLDRTMRGEIKPKIYTARLPMLVGLDMGRTIDPKGPMRQMLDLARQMERQDPEILDISVHAGYSYGDVYEAGPSVTVVSNGANGRFQQAANQLMRKAWDSRNYDSVRFLSVEQAVARAKEPPAGNGPLILADFTDGTFGGGHGDGTHLLTALLDANIERSVVGPIYDPQAVERLSRFPVGTEVRDHVGGFTDETYSGKPAQVSGELLCVGDGKYMRKGAYATGTVGHLGKGVVVRCGNVRVLIVSLRQQPEDREQYRIFGIDPESVNILVCKGINHFRADFGPIAREIVFVDTGGLVNPDVRGFPYQRVRRPVWPLDDISFDTEVPVST